MTSPMELRITDLAAHIRLANDIDERYVVLLGAGASMSSNVPATDKIIAELLEKYGKRFKGEGTVLDQFDKLWDHANDETRLAYVRPYLEQTPSNGYKKLADLVARGFIRLIISFNYDVLPQIALENSTNCRVLELVGGYDPNDKIEKQIESNQADAVIYQLHGSLRNPTSLKFSADDIVSYDPETDEILKGLTSQNIIVCGYAFEDYNVIKAFADFGKSLWWVNPSDPPRTLKALQGRRSSSGFSVVGEFGYFDRFFESLHEELTRDDESKDSKKKSELHNPFKFLASHKETDGALLYYRKKQVQKLYDALSDTRPRAIHLSGKRMAGKTSLVRAGLIPIIPTPDFYPVYIRRCGAEIETRLAAKIMRTTSLDLGTTNIGEALARLCDIKKDQHVVLILDQFERAVSALGELGNDRSITLFDQLFKAPIENLTVIPVFIVDVHFGDDLYITIANEHNYIRDNMYQDVKPLSKHQVGRIVHFQARKADVDIPRKMLDQLIEQYNPKSFTLAHIETICHLLTARMNLDKAVQNQDLIAGSQLVTALNAALVDHDVLSHLEDLPIPEEQNLLRNVLLAASNTSRKDIAEYLKDNFRRMHRDQFWSPKEGPPTEN